MKNLKKYLSFMVVIAILTTGLATLNVRTAKASSGTYRDMNIGSYMTLTSKAPLRTDTVKVPSNKIFTIAAGTSVYVHYARQFDNDGAIWYWCTYSNTDGWIAQERFQSELE